MSTKCQRRGVGGPSNVNVDRNERRNKRCAQNKPVYVTLVLLSGGISIELCVLFCKKIIDSIGGHFPYVNVDTRGVVLPMSTHVKPGGRG